jgi:DNA (cytosine-5)-methyltransferase 1
MGYHRAGFEVVGVDLFEDYGQARYPFDSIKMDALEHLERFSANYDVIVASPPCQRYSITNAARKADYPDLIGPVRELLVQTGKPYVIENVVGAPLIDPLLLCGSMFDLKATDDDGTPLRMERHRLFESNVMMTAPHPCKHDKGVQVAGSYGGARRDKWEAKHIRKGGYVPSGKVQQQLLGIDWMTQKGMHQSIPPAYTEHIGRQLLEVIS